MKRSGIDLVACRRIWSRREKLIERVKYGRVCMYGELEGIMGSGIPALPALEMSHGSENVAVGAVLVGNCSVCTSLDTRLR